MVCNQQVTWQILEKHGKRLFRRFIDILGYEHMEDSIHEVLYVVVLVTNLQDKNLVAELINEGLIQALNKFVELKIQTKTSKLQAELCLQIIANIV